MGVLDSVKEAFTDLYDAITSGNMDSLKEALSKHWPIYLGTIAATWLAVSLLSSSGGGGEGRIQVPIKIIVEEGKGGAAGKS